MNSPWLTLDGEKEFAKIKPECSHPQNDRPRDYLDSVLKPAHGALRTEDCRLPNTVSNLDTTSGLAVLASLIS